MGLHIYRNHQPFFVETKQVNGIFSATMPSGNYGQLPETSAERFAILEAAQELSNMTDDEVLAYNRMVVKGLNDFQNEEIKRRKVIEAQEALLPKPPKRGVVYLAIDEPRGLYKIGFSTNPTGRESQLKTANAGVKFLKTWAATIEDEKVIHETLRGFGICVSGEWYSLRDFDIDFVEQYFAISEMPF